jgi:hypothetical protein
MSIEHLPADVKTHIDALGGIQSMGNHPMSETELNHTEETLGTALSQSHRHLLLAFGAFGFIKSLIINPLSDHPRICDCGLNIFFGSAADEFRGLLRQAKLYSNRLPDTLTPIANNVFGDLICLGINDMESGKVYFWDHENELDWGEYRATYGQDIAVPRALVYQNVHVVASSFDDLLLRLRIWEEADRVPLL